MENAGEFWFINNLESKPYRHITTSQKRFTNATSKKKGWYILSLSDGMLYNARAFFPDSKGSVPGNLTYLWQPKRWTLKGHHHGSCDTLTSHHSHNRHPIVECFFPNEVLPENSKLTAAECAIDGCTFWINLKSDCPSWGILFVDEIRKMASAKNQLWKVSMAATPIWIV